MYYVGYNCLEENCKATLFKKSAVLFYDVAMACEKSFSKELKAVGAGEIVGVDEMYIQLTQSAGRV